MFGNKSSDKPKWEGKKFMGLSGVALQQTIGIAAGAGFLLFGYDQGVMGSLLTLPSFTKQFVSARNPPLLIAREARLTLAHFLL